MARASGPFCFWAPRATRDGRKRLCGYPVAIPAATPTRMPALISSLDPRSQDFLDNAAYHRSLVDDLDTRLAHAAEGGGEKARDKHTERGKLLVRDRITALLDPGSPFLEIAPLAAEGMYDGAAPAAGIEFVHQGAVEGHVVLEVLRTGIEAGGECGHGASLAVIGSKDNRP